MIDFGISKSNSEVSKSNSNILVKNYFFLKNYVTYQVSFYANNYFE